MKLPWYVTLEKDPSTGKVRIVTNSKGYHFVVIKVNKWWACYQYIKLFFKPLISKHYGS